LQGDPTYQKTSSKPELQGRPILLRKLWNE
jgi:hypothetical protein